MSNDKYEFLNNIDLKKNIYDITTNLNTPIVDYISNYFTNNQQISLYNFVNNMYMSNYSPTT